MYRVKNVSRQNSLEAGQNSFEGYIHLNRVTEHF